MPLAKANFTSTRASIHLDTLRGVAALVVMFGHWRHLLFVDFPQVHVARLYRLSLLIPYSVATWGHQAVIIFFVLSGYLVGGSIIRSLQREQWSWTDYLTRRLVRLWIVLIPGIALCYLFDTIGLHSGVAPLLYKGLTGTYELHDVAAQLSPKIAFENLLFLQFGQRPTLGTDSPLWSLANEFWYYIMGALLAVTIWPKRKTVNRVLTCLALVAIAIFCRGSVLYLFPLWLFGAALNFVPLADVGPRFRVWSALAYVLVVLICADYLKNQAISDYLLGIATTLLLAVMLSDLTPICGSAMEKTSRTLASFSYTLYVIHLPLLVLVTGFAIHDARLQPTPIRLALGSLLLISVGIFAYGLSLLTEKNTDAVRIAVEKRLQLVPLAGPHRQP